MQAHDNHWEGGRETKKQEEGEKKQVGLRYMPIMLSF